MDIHNYQRTLVRTIERIEKELPFSEENKKIALKFKDELLATNISISKTNRYLQDVIWLNGKLGKDFNEAQVEDIKRVVSEMNQSELAESTKKGIKTMLRKLYRFIRGVKEKGKYPPEVDWYTLTISNSHSKLPEELLTEEDMRKIILHCRNYRDKALVASLCESGCRVSEIGTMKIKQISFEEYGARLTVQGKTGMRKILVITCAPYLQTWINNHPNNDDPDAPLWIKSDGSNLSYTRICSILHDAAKKAGLRKRVHPHLLRHSRATIMAPKMTDAAMKHYFGWAQGSKMASIYIHMSGKDTDESILRANGIEIKKEEAKTLMQPKKCLKCKTINESTNKFCKICGLPLDKKEAERILKADTDRQRADKIMNQLIEDPEILELIKKKLGA